MINIALSILLGYYFGIAGIVGGVIISLLLVIVGWKSHFLFSRGFGVSAIHYIYVLSRTMVLIGVAWLVSDQLLPYIYTPNSESLIGWLIEGAKGVVLFGVVSTLLFTLFNSYFREFVRQLLKKEKNGKSIQ